MPGPRQSLEVLEGKGRKHLSRSERAQRAAGEVRPAPPKQLRPPLEGDHLLGGSQIALPG